MKQIVIFLTMTIASIVVGCAHGVQYEVRNGEMNIANTPEGKFAIEGGATGASSDFAEFESNTTAGALEKAYRDALAAGDIKKAGEIQNLISAHNYKLPANTFFQGPAKNNYNGSQRPSREEIQERARKKVAQKQNRRY